MSKRELKWKIWFKPADDGYPWYVHWPTWGEDFRGVKLAIRCQTWRRACEYAAMRAQMFGEGKQ